MFKNTNIPSRVDLGDIVKSPMSACAELAPLRKLR
jgi:hypothetical protein